MEWGRYQQRLTETHHPETPRRDALSHAVLTLGAAASLITRHDFYRALAAVTRATLHTATQRCGTMGRTHTSAAGRFYRVRRRSMSGSGAVLESSYGALRTEQRLGRPHVEGG